MQKYRFYLIPFFLFLILAVLAHKYALEESKEVLEREYKEFETEASIIKDRVFSKTTNLTWGIMLLSEILESHSWRSQKSAQNLVDYDNFMTAFPGMVAIALVENLSNANIPLSSANSGFLVRAMAPLPNDHVIGYDMASDVLRRNSLIESATTKRAVLSGEIDFFLGSESLRGRILAYPIFENKKSRVLGWVVAQINFDKIIEAITPSLPEAYSLAISDVDKKDKAWGYSRHILEGPLVSAGYLSYISGTEYLITISHSEKSIIAESNNRYYLYLITMLSISAILSSSVFYFLAIHRRVSNELRSIYSAINANALISVTDLSGKIIDVNDNFLGISGYERSQLIGANHRLLKSGLHDKSFYQDLWKTISTGNAWRGILANRNKLGGIYWVDSVVAPVLDYSGSIHRYISFHFDITEQVMNQKKQQENEKRVLETSRLSALGEMAGGIAHEINTPLSVILLSCEAMQGHLVKGKKLDLDRISELLYKVMDTTKQVALITRSMRDLCRDGTNDPMANESLADIVNSAAALVLNEINYYQINFHMDFDLEDDLLLMCRKVQLSQVILNLLKNAIDAVKEVKEKEISLKIQSGTDHVEIALENSGSPIPESIRDKIFQPFFTTKHSGQGTGLGLSISLKIIHAHEGTLKYDGTHSSPRFVIRLPLRKISQELIAV